MAIDINGALIETSNAALKMTASALTGLDTNSSGFITLVRRPYFVAYGSGGGTQLTTNNWTIITFPSTYVNNGSHFNTSTHAFTAPVTGSYYFESMTYGTKTPSSNADSYTHPAFWVNNNPTVRNPTSGGPWRLRSRTYYSSTYSYDTQINDIFYLQAGDFVQLYMYSGGTLTWVGAYSHFTGFFIG